MVGREEAAGEVRSRNNLDDGLRVGGEAAREGWARVGGREARRTFIGGVTARGGGMRERQRQERGANDGARREARAEAMAAEVGVCHVGGEGEGGTALLASGVRRGARRAGKGGRAA